MSAQPTAEIAPHGAELVAQMPHFVVVAAPEPDDLTWHQADEITGRIRRGLRALDHAMEDVVALAAQVTADVERAWACRADQALRYDSWEAYIADQFGTLRQVRLPIPERVQLVAALASTDLSKRAVGRVLRLADQTIRADLRLASKPESADDEPTAAEPESLLASEVGPARPPSKVTRTLTALEPAGTGGLTAPEVDSRYGWRHGTSGAVLSELHARHRVARTTDTRAGYAVYLALEHATGRDVEAPGRRPRVSR